MKRNAYKYCIQFGAIFCKDVRLIQSHSLHVSVYAANHVLIYLMISDKFDKTETFKTKKKNPLLFVEGWMDRWMEEDGEEETSDKDPA